MTDEDVQKIQAIVDGLDAAIRDAWPALIGHRLGSVGSMPDYVKHLLRLAVTRMRNEEARAEAERKRAADLEAAQAARPDHAQQARDGSWWWTSDGGRWTNGIDRDTQPPEGVRWRAAVDDVGARPVADDGTPLCGRSAWSGLVVALDEPPCVLCQRADREVTRG